MNRRSVYLTTFRFPDRDNPGQWTELEKYVVILRTALDEADVPLVVASSFKIPRPIEDYEYVIRATVEGFPHDTIVDGRWVHTIPVSWVGDRFQFNLSGAIMREIDISIVVGLQIKHA